MNDKKISKISIDRYSVTDNTDNTDNTDKAKKLSVLSVLRDKKVFDTLFGENLFEQILKIFAVSNESFTYDKIAEKLDRTPDNIKQAMNRKKEYFSHYLLKNKKRVSRLSRIAIDEINSRISQKNAEIEQKKLSKQKLEEQEELRKNFEENVLRFLQETNPKRKNQALIIDFDVLVEHDYKLADEFLNNPTRFIDFLRNYFDNKLSISIINLPKGIILNIEDIRKEHLDKVICVEGRIASIGSVRPLATSISYECPNCGTLIKIQQNYRIGTIKEPNRCSCGSRGGFRIISVTEKNASYLQLEDLHEKTDNPHSQRIKSIIFDNLCDKEKISDFVPGNEVRCVGVLKRVPIKVAGKISTLFDWIFEIISSELIEKEIDVTQFTDENLDRINELSSKIDRNGISELLPSFAPDIHGYDEIKSALILQLCNKRNNKKNKSVRNKSNILLIGDPGVAKSVLCDFAISITTGSRKAVGGGSSAVGITASVQKEEDSLGGYRVEPGAMILAKDLLFIDELNNLSEEDKPKLQEGMSEQTISINKANLHVQMKVTCGILSASNPLHGHFIEDGKTTIQEQFNIPSPILNRFDSIFVLRDEVNEINDKLIAERMIQRQRGLLKPDYEKEFLKKFFVYIKNQEEPKINDSITKKFQKIYSKARKNFSSGVKINARFLESLTRMAISSAKLRLDKEIKEKDIILALKILSKSQYLINETIYLESNKQ